MAEFFSPQIPGDEEVSFAGLIPKGPLLDTKKAAEEAARDAINIARVFSSSVADIEKTNSALTNLTGKLLPVEAATVKYNMEQQKLNDLTVKSKTILDQEANSWAVRLTDLKNTQASEETIKTEKEKFNRVIAQTARNLKLVAAAQLELNRIRARSVIIVFSF